MAQNFDSNVVKLPLDGEASSDENHKVELSKEELQKKAVLRFHRLTYAIVGEISSMLKKAKVMPLEDLQNHNPTFEEVVKQLRIFRVLSQAAAEALKIDKSAELSEIDVYIDLADDLAKAIILDDYDALCGAIGALDSKPYI